MHRSLTTKIILLLTTVAAAAVGTWLLWSYIFSFQTVTFHFDRQLGYIELSGNNQPNYYPADNQPVKLKKGTYQVRSVGAHIAADRHAQVIDGSTSNITAEFGYSRSYLDTLYLGEQQVIESTLIAAYPKVATDYDIRHGKLYHLGEVYGASLVMRDQSNDNADILHVLMEKKNGSWIILSKPPMPILSAPLYPSISRNILVDINRAQ
ncbi:hypothetical protein GII36_00020 [Candidatus Mycosynbacter amalyticus]|uniref:Uncharacterized protein n=1 Tax=Candidatus Mycosynbacter amalyticus TaxID=2665156 RepID=A0A857MI66_9BACT|nr:hypothetical protein [Candidatus Mycosynbacter amalyticus]QHN42254.1 hypothetical protein GII36_00020 [Candidatus Mycosynbacter amalyticus]